MGMDLKLLPLLAKDFWCSHNIIALGRDYELWKAIESLPQFDIPQSLSCYFARTPEGEPCYGDIETSPYGERLKWIAAKMLNTVRDHDAVKGDWRNRAAWAYLANIPEDWRVVLYWC